MRRVRSPSRRSEQWRRDTPAAARGSAMCGVLETSSVPIDRPLSGKAHRVAAEQDVRDRQRATRRGRHRRHVFDAASRAPWSAMRATRRRRRGAAVGFGRLQRGRHRGEPGGRDHERRPARVRARAPGIPASGAIRPAAPALRPVRRCAPNAPAARARGRTAAPRRRTTARPLRRRSATRLLRAAASARPSVAARAATCGSAANRRCSTARLSSGSKRVFLTMAAATATSHRS